MSKEASDIQSKESAALLKSREKRKWQIALRRYVMEKTPSKSYAPYFGLDMVKMRLWFEYQFQNEFTWSDFGKKWQFDHIIPVTYFDFSVEKELKMCWNFTNLRLEGIQKNKDRGARLDVLAAKGYFERLYKETAYFLCKDLLAKIDQIELSEFVSTNAQRDFIISHAEYLNLIQNYSAFEFELINMGRSIEEVNQALVMHKKFGA